MKQPIPSSSEENRKPLLLSLLILLMFLGATALGVFIYDEFSNRPDDTADAADASQIFPDGGTASPVLKTPTATTQPEGANPPRILDSPTATQPTSITEPTNTTQPAPTATTSSVTTTTQPTTSSTTTTTQPTTTTTEPTTTTSSTTTTTSSTTTTTQPTTTTRRPENNRPDIFEPPVTTQAPSPPPSLAEELALGSSHSCVLLEDGRVQCWGAGNRGQLGDGVSIRRTNTPVFISGISTAASISTGDNHTCVVLEDGTVRCWGGGSSGQLGDGSTTRNARSPVTVSGISTAVSIAAGPFHTCAVLEDATVWCWGGNNRGQLGDGTTIQRNTPVQVLLEFSGDTFLTSVAQVSAGQLHTCAVLDDGTARCWGENITGILGDSPTLNVLGNLNPRSVAVLGVSTATSISAGSNHTCVVLEDRTIQCWGLNTFGQLGEGTTNDLSAPSTTVSGISTAAQVSAKQTHTCAVLADETVRCWGRNDNGQLGDGTFVGKNTPVAVMGISTATQVSAGLIHTCAVLVDKTVQCWGNNFASQLGDGEPFLQNTPVAVQAIDTATQVSAGNDYTCSLLEDMTIRCWGGNVSGELGNGANLASSTPVVVLGLGTAAQVSAGVAHTCAVLADDAATLDTNEAGMVRCWGGNANGQLGNNLAPTPSNIPVAVTGISTATQVSVKLNHTCAVLADDATTEDVDEAGMVQCWGGNNQGQLGDGTNTESLIPVAVMGIDTATQVSAGYDYSCALLEDTTVWCWGSNRDGRLGDGTTTDTNIPVQVLLDPAATPPTPLTSVIQISTALNHTCAVLQDMTIRCWGSNTNSKLGDGGFTSSPTPVVVAGITNAASVSVGNNHTCAVLADDATTEDVDEAGMVQCWGSNVNGQLGNSMVRSSSTPITVPGVNTATSVSTGLAHTCVVLTDGTMRCWGFNENGRLGDGRAIYRTVPVGIVLPRQDP